MISVVIPFIEITHSLLSSLSILSSSDKVNQIILVQNSFTYTDRLTNFAKITIVKSPALFNRSIARNYGAHCSKNEYILFLDQDVLLSTDFVENMDEVQLSHYDVILPKIIPYSSKETKASKVYINAYERVSRGDFCIFSRIDVAIPNFDSACFIIKKDFFLKPPMFNSKFIRYEDRHWARHAVHRNGHFYCDGNLISHKYIGDKNRGRLFIDHIIDSIYQLISNQYFYRHCSKFPYYKKNLGSGVVKFVINLFDKNVINVSDCYFTINQRNQRQTLKLSQRSSITSTKGKHKIINLDNYEYCILNLDEAKTLETIKETGLLDEGVNSFQVLKKLSKIGLISRLETR